MNKSFKAIQLGLILAFAVAATPGTANAHPGHGLHPEETAIAIGAGVLAMIAGLAMLKWIRR